MAVIFSDVLKFLRIIARPFSPELPNNESNFSALKVIYLLLLHIFFSLFIFISGKRSVGECVGNGIGTRAIVIVFVIVGITLLVVLVIRGCQNKLKASCTALTRMSKPSLDPRIIFLWIFGFVVIVHILINLAIYIQCIETLQEGSGRGQC